MTKRKSRRISNPGLSATLVMVLAFAFAPPNVIAHGGESMPSAGRESRGKPVRPTHKTEQAALEEMSFLLRDIEKRMRNGDVEGVHTGAQEFAATADNLWLVGLKNSKDRNLKTINGYMNLLKSVAQELNAFGGMGDMEFGREQLSRLRENLAAIRKQYFPALKEESGGEIPFDSTAAVTPARVDSGGHHPRGIAGESKSGTLERPNETEPHSY